MKTKLLVILVICFVTISCRSTKETLRTKVDTKTETTVKTSNSVDSVSHTTDKSTAVITTDEVVTIAELSKPDSAGKQYPVKVTTITRKQNTAVRNDVKKESHVKASSDYKSDSKQKTTVKETSTTTHSIDVPWWVWVILAFIASVIAFYIRVRNFKKLL